MSSDSVELVKFGLSLPYGAGVAADPDWLKSFVSNADASGFESIYAVEHVVMVAGHEDRYPYSENGQVPLADDCPLPDPLDLLAYLAAFTTRIKLGTSVLVAPHHHPLVLAKRLATIDRLSGGRMLLGLGVGWMREEIEATGNTFETRGRQTDELIQAMRVAWSDEVASFDGEFFSFSDTVSEPRPVQAGGVPIHIGGHSPAAAKRAGRLGDGFQPLGLHGEVLAERLATMRQAADDAGRDPDSIEVTLRGSLQSIDEAKVESLAAAGATRVVLSPGTADLDQLAEQLWAVSALIGTDA